MAIYTKETALFDTGAIGDAIDTASETASKFLSMDNTGIMVYDGSNGAQTPSGVTSGTKNVFIDDDSVDLRNGADSLACFSLDDMISGNRYTGTLIEAKQSIGLFPYSDDIGDSGVIITGFGSASDKRLHIRYGKNGDFASEPRGLFTSTSANVSLTSGNISKIPLTSFKEYGAQSIYGSQSDMFTVSNGNATLYDIPEPISVEITASVYVAPTSEALVKVYLYHVKPASTSTTEVASASAKLTNAGGVVQITPRIIDYVMQNDSFYVGVRVFGSPGTGTAYCNNKDTQLQIKFV